MGSVFIWVIFLFFGFDGLPLCFRYLFALKSVKSSRLAFFLWSFSAQFASFVAPERASQSAQCELRGKMEKNERRNRGEETKKWTERTHQSINFLHRQKSNEVTDRGFRPKDSPSPSPLVSSAVFSGFIISVAKQNQKLPREYPVNACECHYSVYAIFSSDL